MSYESKFKVPCPECGKELNLTTTCEHDVRISSLEQELARVREERDAKEESLAEVREQSQVIWDDYLKVKKERDKIKSAAELVVCVLDVARNQKDPEWFWKRVEDLEAALDPKDGGTK